MKLLIYLFLIFCLYGWGAGKLINFFFLFIHFVDEIISFLGKGQSSYNPQNAGSLASTSVESMPNAEQTHASLKNESNDGDGYIMKIPRKQETPSRKRLKTLDIENATAKENFDGMKNTSKHHEESHSKSTRRRLKLAKQSERNNNNKEVTNNNSHVQRQHSKDERRKLKAAEMGLDLKEDENKVDKSKVAAKQKLDRHERKRLKALSDEYKQNVAALQAAHDDRGKLKENHATVNSNKSKNAKKTEKRRLKLNDNDYKIDNATTNEAANIKKQPENKEPTETENKIKSSNKTDEKALKSKVDQYKYSIVTLKGFDDKMEILNFPPQLKAENLTLSQAEKNANKTSNTENKLKNLKKLKPKAKDSQKQPEDSKPNDTNILFERLFNETQHLVNLASAEEKKSSLLARKKQQEAHAAARKRVDNASNATVSGSVAKTEALKKASKSERKKLKAESKYAAKLQASNDSLSNNDKANDQSSNITSIYETGKLSKAERKKLKEEINNIALSMNNSNSSNTRNEDAKMEKSLRKAERKKSKSEAATAAANQEATPNLNGSGISKPNLAINLTISSKLAEKPSKSSNKSNETPTKAKEATLDAPVAPQSAKKINIFPPSRLATAPPNKSASKSNIQHSNSHPSSSSVPNAGSSEGNV